MLISVRCQAPDLSSFEEVEADEAGGEDFVAAVAVPVCDVDAVDHAFIGFRDEFALPGGRWVADQRRVAPVVWALGGGVGERGVDDDGAAAGGVGDAEAVGGGDAVDFAGGPGLADVGAGGEDGDDTLAAGGFVFETAGEDDLQLAAGLEDRAVDHAALVGCQDVALPGGVFEPDEFLHAAGQGDEVGFAVLVEVGGDHLVAALEVRGEGVGVKTDRGFRDGSPCDEWDDGEQVC